MVLATFAIAEIVAGVILNSDYLGGPTGIVVNDYIETELILIVAVVVVLFGFYLMSTRVGLAMRAVHDDDAVANLMGVNTRAIQIGAFTLGGAIAGLSGGLYALYFGFVEAQYFNANISIFVLLLIAISKDSRTHSGTNASSILLPITSCDSRLRISYILLFK